MKTEEAEPESARPSFLSVRVQTGTRTGIHEGEGEEEEEETGPMARGYKIIKKMLII